MCDKLMGYLPDGEHFINISTMELTAENSWRNYRLKLFVIINNTAEYGENDMEMSRKNIFNTP